MTTEPTANTATTPAVLPPNTPLSTLQPLYQATRSCSSCALRATCEGAVPGEGPSDALIMFIGESPGHNETRDGFPSRGKTGYFFDHLLDRVIKYPRDRVWVTNILRCSTPGNRNPLPEELAACAQWTQMELALCEPLLVVTMGAFASKELLGMSEDDTMEQLHGVPMFGVQTGNESNSYNIPVVLPVYHPTAGLNNTRLMQAIQQDFMKVGELAQALQRSSPVDDVSRIDFKLRLERAAEALVVQDAHPDPVYQEIHTLDEIRQYINAAEDRLSLDTETLTGPGGPDASQDVLWSVQLSHTPGEGVFIKASLWQEMVEFCREQGVPLFKATTRLYLHNWLYDARLLPEIRQHTRTYDTMVMAYLLGLSQGLKALGRQLCGVEMLEFKEMLRPQEEVATRAYLEWIVAQNTLEKFPLAEAVYEAKWDRKLGRISERFKRPQHISTKVKRILKDVDTKGADLLERWAKLTPHEKQIVWDVGEEPLVTIADVPHETAVEYSARDADITIRVALELEQRIDAAQLREVLDTQDMPILEPVLDMMDNGMPLDGGVLRSLSEELGGALKVKAEELAWQAAGQINMDNALINVPTIEGPHRFNPASSEQVADLLYGLLKFPITKRTKTLLPSTDDKELRKIDSPLIDPIIDYREQAKAKNTYTEKLPGFIRSDGRIHAQIRTTGTGTGRLSALDPNVQNIPTRTALGKRIRKAFKMLDGYTLVAADYGQVEMRVAMHQARCWNGITLFREGRDIHTETAARINQIDLETAREDRYRYPVKSMGFGVLYGITPHGLLDQMLAAKVQGWDLQRCRGFMDDYFKLYPELSDYQAWAHAFARRHGYIVDMWGRRRWIPEFICPFDDVQASGERQAGNMPIQSGAGGIIKRAMATLYQSWLGLDPETQGGIQWLLQQHDELDWMVRDDLVEYVKWTYSNIMAHSASLLMPLQVTVEVAKDWGSLEEVLVVDGQYQR